MDEQLGKGTSTASSHDDHLALKLARDELAVELLTNRVLTQARTVVFTEQRVLAVAAAAILAIFGVTSWMSIDDKIQASVTTKIDREVQKKVEDIQRQTEKLNGIISETENKLKSLNEQVTDFDQRVQKAKRHIESQVAITEGLRETLQAQAQAVPRATSETSEELRSALGPISSNTAIVVGSGVQSFGHGSDTPTGGAFTTQFLKASRSPRADKNGDDILTLKEAVDETRRLLAEGLFKQDPLMTGSDIGLFRLANTQASVPEGKLHAVIAGVGQVGPSANLAASPLQGPSRDVANLRTRLEEQATINRKEIAITALNNPTWSVARDAILKLQPTETDIVLVYFSGIGLRRPLPSSQAEFGSANSSSNKTRFVLCAVFYDQFVEIPNIVTLVGNLKAGHRILIFDS